MSHLICECVISLIKVPAVEWWEPPGSIFQVATWECCDAIDRKLMGGVYGQPFGVGGVYG